MFLKKHKLLFNVHDFFLQTNMMANMFKKSICQTQPFKVKTQNDLGKKLQQQTIIKTSDFESR